MARPNRPRVSLASDQAVDRLYDYFGQDNLNPTFMRRVLHPAMGLVYRPTVHFALGAHEILSQHFSDGGQLIMPLKHTSMHDPTVMAAVVRHEPLKPLIGNTVVPGKATLFNVPLLGRIITNGGALPVIRRSNVDKFNPAGTPEEVEARRRRAGRALVDVSIEKFNQGHNVVIFPEGTRNQADDAEHNLLNLQAGAGRLACGIDEPEKALVLCGAVNYQTGVRRPVVVFGQPFNVQGTPESMTTEIANSLLFCGQRAAELAART